jgi:hypothetical protein
MMPSILRRNPGRWWPLLEKGEAFSTKAFTFCPVEAVMTLGVRAFGRKASPPLPFVLVTLNRNPKIHGSRKEVRGRLHLQRIA